MYDDQTGNGLRDKAELLESLDPDVFRLLDAVSIARSRRQIEKFYPGELDHIGQFPVQSEPSPPALPHPIKHAWFSLRGNAAV